VAESKSRGTLLIVDDERSFRDSLVEYFTLRGYDTLDAESGSAALQEVEGRTIDAAVVDLVMPGISGMELIKRLKQIDPLTEVVMITAESSVENAVQAMREGAYDYVIKPIRLPDLEICIRRAAERSALSRQNRLYKESQRRRRVHMATEIVARSPTMRSVLETAEGLCQTDAPILIEGETGSGKEVMAEFIHAGSARHDIPMTVLDCGALSASLLEEELFGHEKGTFTGATESRPGMIEIADRGTLFLDEIGDMPVEAQARLLRVLEKGTIRRLGARKEKLVDVRIVAATNRNLDEAIADGRFRQDLYHRLLVFRIVIPPLRERREDILPLADSFIYKGARGGSVSIGLSDDAKELLMAYSWPGNVRELAHTMERASLYARTNKSAEICPEHLALPGSDTGQKDTGSSSLKEVEQRHIKDVLLSVGGHRKRAAEILGLSERQLYRKLSACHNCQQDMT